MPRSEITLHVVGLDELRTGLWCPRCNLPSGVAQVVGVSLRLTVIAVRRLAACRDCGRRIDDDEA